MQLSDPVTLILGVGQTYTSRLKRLGITTVAHLLDHFPARYLDYSKITPIKSLLPQQEVCLKAQVVSFSNIHTRRRLTIQKAQIKDASGQLELTWFNQPFLKNALQEGRLLFFTGKTDRQGVLNSPDVDTLKSIQIHSHRLVPIYPQTYGVSSKWLRHKIHLTLQTSPIPEILPPGSFPRLIDLKSAYHQIHFPDSTQAQQLAEKRLAYNDLLAIHLKSILTKLDWQSHSAQPLTINPQLHQRLTKTLGFTLTSDQQSATKHIFTDLQQKTPMNRLLQGDVGSGKTVVAAAAILQVVKQKNQAILMAPTQVLANQHFKTLSDLLQPFNLKPRLVTSSTKTKKMDPQTDSTNLLIGTHALLHRQELSKDQLALLIVDEQHRFGVLQRSHFLQDKKTLPHVLTMTATPIPRTIALSLYGHLDISNIFKMPQGRKKIKTWVVPETKRQSAYRWIKDQLKTHHTQAFIVCPLIDDSEADTLKNVKAATTEYQRLSETIFPDLKLALLHGRMKESEKNQVLTDFTKQKYQILVTTPVIEVGLDIKNASIMIIEGAQRFGLAQLHQLRGRVGRGSRQSYCLLFDSSQDKSSISRLQLLETNSQGLNLARLDLKIRGAGEVFGTAQSGHLDTRFDLFWDIKLSRLARSTANTLAKKDPSKAQKLLALLSPQLAKYTPAN